MTTLEAARLAVRLGDRTILSGIDLDLAPSSFVGLLGPNGAGKSTLLRTLAGLLPHDGEIRLDGTPVEWLPRRKRAQTLGYLAQSREIAWSLRVDEVVGLGRLAHRSDFARASRADTEAIARALARTGLATFAARPADRLSGGEVARVLLARLLAQETDLLFADEPTAGLDPAHQLATMQTFTDLARDGRTVFASLHDATLAARFCDRLVVVADGGIVADGPPRAVLTPALAARVWGIEVDVVERPEGLVFVPLRLLPPEPVEAER